MHVLSKNARKGSQRKREGGIKIRIRNKSFAKVTVYIYVSALYKLKKHET